MKTNISKSTAFLLGIGYAVFSFIMWGYLLNYTVAYFDELIDVKKTTQFVYIEREDVNKEGNPLMAERIIRICKENGMTKDEDIKWVLGKLWNESRWDQYAIGVNKGGTVDRGIAQWNNYYHPEVTNECAFSVECAVAELVKYRRDGKDIWYASDNL
jgi:hypothetical protein